MSETRRVIAGVDLHPFREISAWSGAYEVELLAPTAWYKADAITGKLEGDAVSSWLDSSGNSRTLTGASTYRRSPFGGRPWLQFNGTSDGLQSAVELSAVLGVGMIGTVFFVYSSSLTTGTGSIWSQNGSHRKSAHIVASSVIRASVRDAGGIKIADSGSNIDLRFESFTALKARPQGAGKALPH